MKFPSHILKLDEAEIVINFERNFLSTSIWTNLSFAKTNQEMLFLRKKAADCRQFLVQVHSVPGYPGTYTPTELHHNS